jgi:NAD(P)-dependent dehydrogenase (short-subunit alcohol dehydrogenase family)
MTKATFDFQGKVVVVTGASSGLGVAFAEGFAAAGADLVLGARRLERLERTRGAVEALGRQALAVRTDVNNPADCRGLVDAAVERFGRLDVLINNAGVGGGAPAISEDPVQFRRIVEVNLHGSYFMAQACGQAMRPGSSIVNVGSVLGSTSRGLPRAAYSSSKAAIVGLTRDLAHQWTGPKGIRVNAIAPGFFATEMTDAFAPGFLKTVLKGIPAGRVGELREVVDVALFLASDSASYVSGALLPVDGGLLTGWKVEDSQ